jgi:Na+/proline symporter
MLTGAIWVLSYCGLHIPSEWPETWVVPSLAIDPYSRLSLATVLLGSLVMGLVVKTGDQMALQRFVAARSTRAAQGVMLGGFACDLLLTGLLVLVGLALLGYSPGAGAGDDVFPRFLASLPRGVFGLMLAALLAAGMSSLSSGINAIHLTLTVRKA